MKYTIVRVSYTNLLCLLVSRQKAYYLVYFRNSVCTCCITPEATGNSNIKSYGRDIPYGNIDNIIIGRVVFRFPVRDLSLKDLNSLKPGKEQGYDRTGLGTESPAMHCRDLNSQ